MNKRPFHKITDIKKLLASIWDWGQYIGCFPRGIHPSDLDGWVELNHKFIFIETKGVGVVMPTGQGKGLERLSRLPGVTVLLVEGAKNKPQAITMLVNGRYSPVRPDDNIRLCKVFKLWSKFSYQERYVNFDNYYLDVR